MATSPLLPVGPFYKNTTNLPNSVSCFLLIMSLAEKWGLRRGVAVLLPLLKIHQDKRSNFLHMGESLLGVQHTLRAVTEVYTDPRPHCAKQLKTNFVSESVFLASTILRTFFNFFINFFFNQMKQIWSCGRCILSLRPISEEIVWWKQSVEAVYIVDI